MRLPKALTNISLIVGALITLTIIVLAVFAPWFATHGVEQMDMRNRFAGPTMDHILGTDNFGRDLWSRLIFGARISLTIAVISVGVSAVIGTIVGLVAGYFGGWVDRVLMGFTDIFLSMPKLILALAFVAALGPGIENAVIAIAITSWPAYARIARAETLTFRNSEFIAAVR